MTKRLPVLALVLATLAGGAFAADGKPAPLAASVSVSGGTATDAGGMLVGANGGPLQEATLENMLPLIPVRAEFTIERVQTKGELAQVLAVSRDGRIQLSLPVAQDVVPQAELAPGDTLTATTQLGRLMVFSKGNTPLGFLVKPGMSVTQN